MIEPHRPKILPLHFQQFLINLMGQVQKFGDKNPQGLMLKKHDAKELR